jgi:hypothetical protein
VKRKLGEDFEIAAFEKAVQALLFVGDFTVYDLELCGKQVLRLGNRLPFEERARAKIGGACHQGKGDEGKD